MVANTNTLNNEGQDILSQPVIKWPDGNISTWANMFDGSICWGSSGGGKSSGPGILMLRQILRNALRPGMVIPCLKTDEREKIVAEVKAAGREDDLIILDEDSSYFVGALEYEVRRRGRSRPNFNSGVDITMEIMLLGDHNQAGGPSGGSDQRYWDKELRSLLLYLIMLLYLADEIISFPNMRKLMVDSFSQEDVDRYFALWQHIENGTAQEQEEAGDEYLSWVDSNYFLTCFDTANRKEDLTAEEKKNLLLVGDFFLKESPKVAPKTTAIVKSSVRGLLQPFMTGILEKQFSGKMSPEVMPERCYKENKIFIIDYSILEEGISAIYAVGIIKKLFQLCQQRRKVKHETNPVPVVFFADEYHYFISPTSDPEFQTTCRSTMTACVYITQNIDNIKIAMGKDLSDAKTKSLLGNLATQIFCANIGDTNKYAAELIGRDFQKKSSSSINSSESFSKTYREELHHIIRPEEFARLKTGGADHNFQVDTIIFTRGKNWKNTDDNFIRCTFDQRRNPDETKNALTRFTEKAKGLFSNKATVAAPKKDQKDVPSFVPKFGDIDLIRSVMKSDFWRCILMGHPAALWIFIKSVFLLKVEMFISPLRAMLRYQHGNRTNGMIITLFTTLMMIGFNAKTLWGIIASVMPFAAPLLPLVMDGDQLAQTGFTQIRSMGLLVFWGVYLMLSVVHLVMIYKRGKSESKDKIRSTKRGTSWLYTLVFRRMKVPEHVVQIFIEPLIIGALGCGLIATGADFTLGLFLVISSVCLFGQEVYDAVSRHIIINS